VPFLDSGLSSRAFFEYLTYAWPYVPPPQHGVRRVAMQSMQHAGRPMVLFLTESVSQKSEHVFR
jgi:hypothetical protein